MFIGSLKPGVVLPAFFLATLLAYILYGKMYDLKAAQNAVSICRLVYEKHYLGRHALTSWFRQCAQAVRKQSDKTDLLQALDFQLAQVPGSHLRIYTPEEDEFVWKARGNSTGLDFISVNGRVILWEIHPEVLKQHSRLKKGMELVSVNGQPLLSRADFQGVEGDYRFKSSTDKIDEFIDVQISLQRLNMLKKPELTFHYGELAVLKISTFRTDAFLEGWDEIEEQIGKLKSLTVDLRGNSGGSFVAMMMALSPFLCESGSAGTLLSPQVEGKTEVDIERNLQEDPLLEVIGKVRRVNLQAFRAKSCFTGEARILVDQETRSVAEIFAAAMKDKSRYRVEGKRTAGEVLLAVWYDLEGFGEGFSISIPEAVYESPLGERFEGIGVEPDRQLFYELPQVVRGVDNWLKR